MELKLANKLGVSRTPIREAIRKLELEGLVIMSPRKGAEVAEITEDNLRDVLEVRGALEELAMKLACRRIEKGDIGKLKRASQNFNEALTSDDVTKIAEADVAFHDIIYMATNNKRLIQLLNNIREQMYRYRVEHLKQKECYSRLSKEHKEMIIALEEGNEEVALALIKEHIENQAETVIDSIRHKEK